MKVKKYTAPTMREALDKMKQELGSAAVILGSRKVSRGGLLDFLGKDMFEVTATTEQAVLKKPRPANGDSSGSRISVTVGDNGPLNQRKAGFDSTLQGTLPPIPSLSGNGGGTSAQPAGRTRPSGAPASDHLLKQELRELRSALGQMAEHLKYQRMPALPPVLREIYRKLVDIELEEKTASELIQKLYARFNESEYNDVRKVEACLIGEIASMIEVAAPPPVRTGSPVVIAFTGPSGVGKTTSLAKLATSEKFYGGRNVAMITADTYRVAATQQLGVFSEITEIPMEVVHSPRDMTRAVKAHSDKDVVLIDTPGASQFNDKMIDELKSLTTAAGPDEVQLVLSVNSKPRDMEHAIRSFRTGGTMRLLLTKFDETLSFGSIVSVVRDSGIPVSLLTFGQEVPEDIETADSKKIARLVVSNVL